MTATLLLRLRGPMQSWGDQSRYASRDTRPYPTKSGVLGLIAAAEGRRRTDEIEDLANLFFAVRVDQPGSIMHDYQTAERWQTGGKPHLVSRYYLTDAVFVAAVQAEEHALLEGIAEKLQAPRFPLFLGRRSCPANHDLVIGVEKGHAVDILRHYPWQASKSHRHTRPTSVDLTIFHDKRPDDPDGEPRQDVPVSFDPAHRRYGWRTIISTVSDPVPNPDGKSATDPFFEAVLSS